MDHMDNILALARSTSTDVLCAAWGLSASSVRARKKGKRPMTLKEAGALAELHGLTLDGAFTFQATLSPDGKLNVTEA